MSSSATASSTTSSSNEFPDCPRFVSEEEHDAYVESIQPHRELICPITQELMRDPVVAEDGYTYEREAILRWFSVGRIRSPVTNELMGGQSIHPNRAVQSMTQAHREKLGQELLHRAYGIFKNQGRCDDNGSRILALLDAGADVSLRTQQQLQHDDNDDEVNNHSALLLLIQSGNLPLCRLLLQHDTPVTGTVSYMKAVERNIQKESPTVARDWRSFLEDLQSKARQQQISKEERENARNQANEARRLLQQDLAIQHRRGNLQQGSALGVGDLEDGLGFFPSLVTLQFQSSIPPPSRSVATIENLEKQRMKHILTTICFLTILLLVIL